MYEAYCWVALSDSSFEDNTNVIQREANALFELGKTLQPPTGRFELGVLNGQNYLWMAVNANRARKEAEVVDRIFDLAGMRLPGSHGLLYERDDSMEIPPGANAYRVKVLARGQVDVRLDPFLSPCMPTIEDP